MRCPRLLAAAFASLIGLSGSLACSGEGPGGLPPPEDAKLLIGGAASDGSGYVELVAGEDVTLVPGGQGGFHVWLRLRGLGLEPGMLAIERNARRVSDGALILRTMDRKEMASPLPDGEWFEVSDPMASFMCPSPIGVSVIDTEVRFEVSVVDPSGVSANAAITLVPRCPPDPDLRRYCERLCTG
jgi:hypothetical protein